MLFHLIKVPWDCLLKIWDVYSAALDNSIFDLLALLKWLFIIFVYHPQLQKLPLNVLYYFQKSYEHKQYKNGLKFAKQILTNPKYQEHGG